MSTFIWGKIKFKTVPEILEDYHKDNILIYFYKEVKTYKEKSPLYLSELGEREIYFNIACGYEQVIPKNNKYPYLCSNSSFFNLNIPKKMKCVDFELYYPALKERLKRLQDLIIEIYNNPNVEKITYFHADDGNVISLDEYKIVNWKIEDFAERFFDAIEECRGLTPTIQVMWKK